MNDPNIAGDVDLPLPILVEEIGPLERLRRYVELESPSNDAERLTRLAETIAVDLERELGVAVARLAAPGAGTNLHARIHGREPSEAPLMLLAHMDTVHPVGTLERQPFRLVDGRVEGPGVYDMKAGIVVLIEALKNVTRASGPRRTVELVLTCDEEVGSEASRELIERTALGTRAVLVLEPCLPGGAAKTARKGVADYRFRVSGRAAHAGIAPGSGVSATVELAHLILRASALADLERGVSVTVGMVRGGTATNVVPAEAWADIDVRFPTGGEGIEIDAALRALQPVQDGASVEIVAFRSRPPLERTPAVLELYERARALAAELGWELGEGGSGGGSDGCLTAALGVPTLDGIGVDGGGAHSAGEYILVDDLPRRIALLQRLLEVL